MIVKNSPCPTRLGRRIVDSAGRLQDGKRTRPGRLLFVCCRYAYTYAVANGDSVSLSNPVVGDSGRLCIAVDFVGESRPATVRQVGSSRFTLYSQE